MEKIPERKVYLIVQVSNNSNKEANTGMLCMPNQTLWSPNIVPHQSSHKNDRWLSIQNGKKGF